MTGKLQTGEKNDYDSFKIFASHVENGLQSGINQKVAAAIG